MSKSELDLGYFEQISRGQAFRKSFCSMWKFESVFENRERYHLKILPGTGFISDDKVLAISWMWYHGMDSDCVFLKSNSCSIQEKKPLMCSLYPYPDSLRISSPRSWRCVREKKNHVQTNRMNWYHDPLKSRMPLAMRYAALIARKFLQEKSVFDIFEGCGDYRYEFFDKISEIKKDVIYAKPFYGEMTKIGVIPEKFLAVMKMDTTLEAKYKELNDFPYTSINNKIHDDHKTDVDIIFDRWDESPSTRMELQNINQP